MRALVSFAGALLVAACFSAGFLACVGDAAVETTQASPDAFAWPGDAGALDGAAAVDGASSQGDAAPPVSTFCAGRIQALGADKVLLCADFDDAQWPFGAWRGGDHFPTAFQESEVRGAAAALQPGSLGPNPSGMKLYLEKPANGGAATETGVRFSTVFAAHEPEQGLRIAFDVYGRRANGAASLAFFRLLGSDGPVVRAEDSMGNPGFIGSQGGVAAPLYVEASLESVWHVELVVNPNAANTEFVLSGTLNGAPLHNEAETASRVAQAMERTSTSRSRRARPRRRRGPPSSSSTTCS